MTKVNMILLFLCLQGVWGYLEFALPESWELAWWDQNSPVSIWQPDCPLGFYALGDTLALGRTIPPLDYGLCVTQGPTDIFFVTCIAMGKKVEYFDKNKGLWMVTENNKQWIII
eukprot:TRINITY_DN15058_c0_g1_i1.p1 TRINITY_DN15058_c0_g1~~TRINITY_DN15058_c0_g1_i1.p1  ORF type:complete len:134 (+),score=19.52 TRINITY_DN15058_c0_g1_i1:63-404(+)